MPAQMRSLNIILDNPPMPRRRARTTAQLDELFALPTEPEHAGPVLDPGWHRSRHRLGFALQLCALRYPGRFWGRAN